MIYESEILDIDISKSLNCIRNITYYVKFLRTTMPLSLFYTKKNIPHYFKKNQNVFII